MKYEYLFFDLDGTLTDSAPGITKGVQHALKTIGIEEPDLNRLLPFIGPPLDESFSRYYHIEGEEYVRALAAFHDYYDDFGCFDNAPYEGITELLELLQREGFKLVLATSKPRETALKIMERFDLDRYFAYIGGGTLDEARNGKAEVIEDSLKILGDPDKKKVLMIGDRCFDIIGAKKNGLVSMGVLYGFGSREELLEAGADLIAEKVSDILPLVR